jgi:hypothetical protein
MYTFSKSFLSRGQSSSHYSSLWLEWVVLPTKSQWFSAFTCNPERDEIAGAYSYSHRADIVPWVWVHKSWWIYRKDRRWSNISIKQRLGSQFEIFHHVCSVIFLLTYPDCYYQCKYTFNASVFHVLNLCELCKYGGFWFFLIQMHPSFLFIRFLANYHPNL